MGLSKSTSSILWGGIQAAAIFAWLTNLQGTDSFYSVYLLCALLGLFSLCDNWGKVRRFTRPVTIWLHVLAGAFSLAVVMANYVLFLPLSVLENSFNGVCTLAGGYFLGYHVLLCALGRLPLSLGEPGDRTRSGRFFFLCFFTTTAVYLLYLFFAAYPGYLVSDSLVSLEQIEAGNYVNNHPFWYTMFIKVCMDLGMALFGDRNKAVALYSAVQGILLAASFAYCLVTLYQKGVNRWWIGITFCLYTFLPYHLAYSVTMWKDVPFGASALVMTVSLYRLLTNVGSSRLNKALFAVGSFFFCLMRTNGWAVYLVTAMIFLLVLRKRGRGILLIMAVILVLTWILTGPLLPVLNVKGTDFVETLAVPFQQLARVIVNDRPLEEEERALLGEIFRLDRIQEVYQPEIVDPVKFEAFREDRRDYLRENLWTYAKLWLSLGLRYPGDYFQAWVDLTKGFWNGGYYYWIYLKWTYPELSGVGGFILDNPVKDAFDALFRYLEKPVILEPLYSIGLHVWLVILCCFICAARKRPEALIMVPFLVLLVGLWFGTPVYAEYRYAYPVFTTYPLILLATVFHTPAPTNPDLLEERHEDPS